MIDEKIEELIKRVLREDLGNLISNELEERFKPIQRQIDQILASNDEISRQIAEDRQNIDKLTIDSSKNLRQNEVIIENQNVAEEKVVEAVKEEADKIPEITEKTVEKMFKNEGLLARIKNKFRRNK